MKKQTNQTKQIIKINLMSEIYIINTITYIKINLIKNNRYVIIIFKLKCIIKYLTYFILFY